MSTFPVLLAGEIQRLKKYNILTASMVVALLWIGVLYIVDAKDISQFFPLLIFIDATSMAILLVGVSIFFEKQEGAFKSLFVTPISKVEYIVSKACANLVSNLGTLIILYLYAWFFKEINLNIFALFGAVILISVFHSFLGVLISYYSKDFTELLLGMFKYFLGTMIPVFLEEFGVIANELFSKIVYILPTKASFTLLRASAGGLELWEVIFSAIYMILACCIIWFVIMRKFDEFASKESGL